MGRGGGGAAQKIMCPLKTELTFGRGQGPWKLQGCLNALSCYLSHIFKHSDKKWI